MANITQMLGLPGQTYFVNGNTYVANSFGLIIGGSNSLGAFTGIQQSDINGLQAAGATYTSLRTRFTALGPVKAAAVANVVASVAFAASTLSIAAQPDVPRPLQVVVTPGAAAITAGPLTLTYTDEHGVVTVDALSGVTGSGTALTLTTSKGCSRLTSAVVGAVVGGVSPTITIGMNANVSLPAEAGFVGLVVYKANTDGADDTLPAAVAGKPANMVTPATAPNATHTLTFGYQFYTA